MKSEEVQHQRRIRSSGDDEHYKGFATAKPEDLRPLGPAIDKRWVGQRLDRYLSSGFPFLSRSGWQKRCLEGRVWVQYRPARASYRLREGDEVHHLYPQHCEPWVNRGVFCFYRCAEVMGLYKPPHLPMHEGGSYRKNTFAEVLRERWGESWGAVHRLDRETSGVVLCGSTQEKRAKLSRAFRHHGIAKTYDALLIGEPREHSWEVDEPIGYAQQTSWRCKRWVDAGGRVACTRFELQEVISGYARVKVYPIHGRTHQIRIHAAYSGYPLVGDTRYHPDERVFLEFIKRGYSQRVLDQIRAPRLCLHAASLKCIPESGSRGAILSEHLNLPMPDDMRWIWQQLAGDPHAVLYEIPEEAGEAFAQRHRQDVVRREGLEPSRSQSSTRPST